MASMFYYPAVFEVLFAVLLPLKRFVPEQYNSDAWKFLFC